MKYPFLFISAGFLAGIILQQYWDCPVPWILALLLTGLTGLWWIRGKKLFFPILAVLFICEGWLCAEFDRQQPFNAVENYIQPRPMVLTGTVRSLPEVKIKGKRLRVSFVLTAEKAEIRKGRHSRIFPVQGDVQAFLLQPSFIPQVGDRIRLRGKLEKPRPALNFGEFEYGRYLAQKRIFSIFETLGKRNATFIEVNQRQWFWRFMAHLRQGIAKRIDQIYPFKEASLLKALIVGIRSDVGPQVRDQFMKTGTVHLFATANTKRDLAPFPNKTIATYSP